MARLTAVGFDEQMYKKLDEKTAKKYLDDVGHYHLMKQWRAYLTQMGERVKRGGIPILDTPIAVGEVEKSAKHGLNVRTFFFNAEQIKHSERAVGEQNTVRIASVAFMNNYGVENFLPKRLKGKHAPWAIIPKDDERTKWAQKSEKATERYMTDNAEKLLDELFGGK